MQNVVKTFYGPLLAPAVAILAISLSLFGVNRPRTGGSMKSLREYRATPNRWIMSPMHGFSNRAGV